MGEVIRNKMNTRVLWFTGLSGSGKSTIASGVSKILRENKFSVKILDGDEIRNSIHAHLGFSPDDISQNNRRIAIICRELLQNYDFILVPIISPFRTSRFTAKEIIGKSFIEVYVKSNLKTVIKRDVKGLYTKALKGKIDNFIGIDPLVPYEPPENPDIVLDTEIETVEESVQKMYNYFGIDQIVV